MPKVLIVEDNEPSRLLFRRFAEAFGAEVYEAGDGFEAVEVMNSTIVDLVLLDMQLPHMDGFEFLMWLRNTSYQPKVVTMSSATMAGKSLSKMGEAFGAVESLTKPIKAIHVASALRLVTA